MVVVSILDSDDITSGGTDTKQDLRDVVTGGIIEAPPGEKHITNTVVFRCSTYVVHMQYYYLFWAQSRSAELEHCSPS